MSEFTEAEKEAIRENWSLVKPKLKDNGIQFFLRFFAAHPSYQDKFVQLRGLSSAQLAVSPKLRAHALSVMSNITQFVDTLDDPECLEQSLIKIARNHYPREVTEEHLKNLAAVFMSFLSDKLGADLNTVAISGWQKLWAALVTVVNRTYAEIKAGNTC